MFSIEKIADNFKKIFLKSAVPSSQCPLLFKLSSLALGIYGAICLAIFEAVR
jgi:hypothetical protein